MPVGLVVDTAASNGRPVDFVRPNEDAALGFTLRVAVKILVVEESKRSDNSFQLYHVRSVGIISGNHHTPLRRRCNLMGYEETEVVASVGPSITL